MKWMHAMVLQLLMVVMCVAHVMRLRYWSQIESVAELIATRLRRLKRMLVVVEGCRMMMEY